MPVNGRTLNRRWGVNAEHALYHTGGTWYHQLTRFPGALFDPNGYVLFETEDDFRGCPHLNIVQDVHAPNGISSIPGYVRVEPEADTPSENRASATRERGPIYEGTPKRIELTRYERDPRARRACLEHYGAVCQACDLEFGEAYGPSVAGLIHVHHLTPLSAVGGNYEVDPIRDLRPVCPNCHAVIHSKTPPYSVEDVRQMRYAS